MNCVDCFIALGGNIGPVVQTLREAARQLSNLGHSFQMSRFYWTEPLSPIPQPRFLNACCRFACTLSPYALLSSLQGIERALGKRPKAREEPRPIDLDLLFYGESILFGPELIVPHPRWHERLFVVRPLADLVDVLPFGIEVQKLAERLDDHCLWTLCD